MKNIKILLGAFFCVGFSALFAQSQTDFNTKLSYNRSESTSSFHLQHTHFNDSDVVDLKIMAGPMDSPLSFYDVIVDLRDENGQVLKLDTLSSTDIDAKIKYQYLILKYPNMQGKVSSGTFTFRDANGATIQSEIIK